MGRGSAQERCLDRRSTSEGMQGWAAATHICIAPATAHPPGMQKDWPAQRLAALPRPTRPPTKTTPNPTDSREEVAATAME